MQEMNDLQGRLPCSGTLKQAMQSASVALRAKNCLIRMAIVYLFCIVALFALSFVCSALLFFSTLLSSPFAEFCLTVSCYTLGLFGFLALILPLWAGRIRMAGRIAAGGDPGKAELFHYFASWRAWWRGVRIGLVCPLSLLIPPLFSAVALAIGNEELSAGRALSLSVRRVSLSRVLGFLGHLLLRVLLGILTLGLYWVLYGAHHSAVSYFALVMQQEK